MYTIATFTHLTIFKGKQPKVVVPPFFPDQAKPYISEAEAKALFDRFNEISQKTGTPIFPMMAIPFLVIILVGITNSISFPSSARIAIGIAMVPISFFTIIGIILFMASKRKTGIKNVVEEWNRTEGIPKGVYFALGTENGVSPEDFFNTSRRYGNSRTVVVNTK